MVSEMPLLPDGCKDMESLCLWTIAKATKLKPRIINELRRHKWWMLQDFSKGRDTPVVYAMFLEIGLDSPPVLKNTTAVVCWSPKPYSWSLVERFMRKIKKQDYPRKGDVVSVISGGASWFEVKQAVPISLPAERSRMLWNSMTNQGWILIAQGEVAAPNYQPMGAA